MLLEITTDSHSKYRRLPRSQLPLAPYSSTLIFRYACCDQLSRMQTFLLLTFRRTC